MSIVVELEQRQAHQGKRREVETALRSPREIFPQPAFLLAGGESAPILRAPIEHALAVDDLVRLLDVFPEEGGPQRGVARNRLLPRASQPAGIERAVDGVTVL